MAYLGNSMRQHGATTGRRRKYMPLTGMMPSPDRSDLTPSLYQGAPPSMAASGEYESVAPVGNVTPGVAPTGLPIEAGSQGDGVGIDYGEAAPSAWDSLDPYGNISPEGRDMIGSESTAGAIRKGLDAFNPFTGGVQGAAVGLGNIVRAFISPIPSLIGHGLYGLYNKAKQQEELSDLHQAFGEKPTSENILSAGLWGDVTGKPPVTTPTPESMYPGLYQGNTFGGGGLRGGGSYGDAASALAAASGNSGSLSGVSAGSLNGVSGFGGGGDDGGFW